VLLDFWYKTQSTSRIREPSPNSILKDVCRMPEVAEIENVLQNNLTGINTWLEISAQFANFGKSLTELLKRSTNLASSTALSENS